ncbi:hypothetical protein [Paracoccus cavernae]
MAATMTHIETRSPLPASLIVIATEIGGAALCGRCSSPSKPPWWLRCWR